MKNFVDTDINHYDNNHRDEIVNPTKIKYWDTELQNYNFKGNLTNLVNPVEFKKKLETVNLLIAIITLILVSGFILL